MVQLISKSRQHFVERRIALKLFRRFWHSLEAYSRGLTYSDVLKIFLANHQVHQFNSIEKYPMQS